MRGLKRVEIFANHSVESNVMASLESKGFANRFTKIPSVHGRGNSDPKQGDHIWPEENFLLVIYCEDQEAGVIEKTIDDIRDDFPDEGVCCFVTG